MSKYTAEQARDWHRMESSWRNQLGMYESERKHSEMADAIDALLRERESANNNDTCTDANCPRCNTPPQYRGDMSHAGIGCYPSRFCGEVVSRRVKNGVDVFTIKPSLGDEFDVIKVSESAKAVVTDEIFEAFDAAQTKAMGEYEMQQYRAGKESHLVNALDFATRAALEAVAPMLASARVPDEKEDLDPVRLRREGRVATEWERGFNEGWNDCRDAMLAASPKPETIWPKNAREKAFSLAREMLKKGSAKPEKE